MTATGTDRIQIIKPNYYDRFACIGPSCSDNCCHTWQVNIDKEHYFQYRNAKNPAFRTLFHQAVSILDHGTDTDFASIALDHGHCSFQDPDGGCKIYRLLGEGSLCNTCHTYPRRRAQYFHNIWELSLSMSCMEAARLCLFECSSVSFLSSTQEIGQKDPLFRIPLVSTGTGKADRPPMFASDLRQACFLLIQCRQYSLAERILSIGVLMQRVDRLIFSGSIAQIPVMVRQYVASVQKGNFHGFFDRLTYQKEAHLAALQLPISHLLAGFRTPVSKPLLELLLPYCIQDPVTEEYQAGREAISFLMDLTKQYDSSLFSSYDQALENYFSNYLFSSLFPFLYHEEGLSFEQTGILLAEQFALLRMLFAFFCHTDGKTGESQLIQAVVALSRSSQHSDLGGDIQKLIQSTGVKSFAHAAYLLR